MNVQIMVYVYLAVCTSMILFNCGYIMLYRRGEQNSRRLDNNLRGLVRRQVLRVEQGEEISSEHVKLMCRRCKNVWNLASWDEELTELSTGHEQAVRDYVREMQQLFIYLAIELKKKDSIQQAHYAYILDKYHVVDEMTCSNIMSFLLEMVQSPNLYCRQNAFKVLYATGDLNAVMQAVQRISDSGHFQHEKILVDGLLSFKGDREELIARLMGIRKKQNEFMQRVILNFARFGSGNYRQEFLTILSDESEPDENRFSALRYFGKYPYDPAEPIIRNFIWHPENQRWEYASIAATVLGSYSGEANIAALKSCLHNANWYIRYNAAVSLERFNLTYIELADVYDGNDRYAREILRYRMEMKRQREEEKGALV